MALLLRIACRPSCVMLVAFSAWLSLSCLSLLLLLLAALISSCRK